MSFVRIKLLAQDVGRGRHSSDTKAYSTRPKEDNKMSLKLKYVQRVKFKVFSSLTYVFLSAGKASLNKAEL